MLVRLHQSWQWHGKHWWPQVWSDRKISKWPPLMLGELGEEWSVHIFSWFGSKLWQALIQTQVVFSNNLGFQTTAKIPVSSHHAPLIYGQDWHKECDLPDEIYCNRHASIETKGLDLRNCGEPRTKVNRKKNVRLVTVILGLAEAIILLSQTSNGTSWSVCLKAATNTKASSRPMPISTNGNVRFHNLQTVLDFFHQVQSFIQTRQSKKSEVPWISR